MTMDDGDDDDGGEERSENRKTNSTRYSTLTIAIRHTDAHLAQGALRHVT